MDIKTKLIHEFNLKSFQIENIIKLIDEGNTIPFIARYRKEAHGSLDDQALREIADRLEYLRGLEKRREEVRELIDKLGKLTDEINESLNKAEILSEIEDIYRPYKPKRKTKASIAREKGLQPLADIIFTAESEESPLEEICAQFIDEEKGVLTIEDALSGAKDIIAEQISDDAAIRKKLRELFLATATIYSKAAKEEDSVYRMYYDYNETVSKIAGHRVLAVDRGEREGFLKVTIETELSKALNILYSAVDPENKKYYSDILKECSDESYSRLIYPSIQREIRSYLSENASEDAIKVFSVNLRQLLMQPPVKGKITLGLDPAYRTGCKTAVVDDTGKVLQTAVIYPTPPHNKIEEASKTLLNLIKKFKVNVIAIGNGTASRETEIFAANLIKNNKLDISYMVVSEAGASVYSASKLAATEFPEFDVSLRSAVSIARRLQDPLAELVKIDPKAIGVGQYQHDMPKARLDEALSGVVEACVNTVGVDLNTASPSLLNRVAGINNTVSQNIVQYREKNGRFNSRKDLLKVAKLGPKAYEQCAGFMKVAESDNVLDNTSVHPESYDAAKELLNLCDYSLDDVKIGNIISLKNAAETIGIQNLAEELNIGIPTLEDIINELLRPGRDPRDELPKPLLRTDILDIKDLKAGMEIEGTVRNVIDFGAFIDIGVHHDGLLHISEITSKYIKHPSEMLKVGQIVKVSVLSVDLEKNRIALSMKNINKTTSAG